jgi:hypothetical protein
LTSTIGERLLWQDGNFKLSQCVFCAHKAPSGATCAAYPEGIPLPIVRNQVDHRKSIYGDDNIHFKAASSDDAAYLMATGFPAVVE